MHTTPLDREEPQIASAAPRRAAPTARRLSVGDRCVVGEVGAAAALRGAAARRRPTFLKPFIFIAFAAFFC